MSAIGENPGPASSQTIEPALSKLLENRALKKSRTPNFQRQESWRYVRIHEPWRKPKGVDSHMRLSVKGWPPLVKIGHRGPKVTRGLHPSGYRDILVHNITELESLSPNTDAARLAAGVGRKKKIELAKRARELSIRVLNGGGLLTGEDILQASEGEEKDKGKSEEEQDIKQEAKKDSEIDTSSSQSSDAGSTRARVKSSRKTKKPKKGQKKKSDKASKKKKAKPPKKGKQKKKK